MDDKKFGEYYRLLRLVQILREEEWSEERMGISRKDAVEKVVAPFARENFGTELLPDDPKFLSEVEKALHLILTSPPETPPPSIPLNLSELVRIHQEHLAREAEEELEKEGVPSLSEQIKRAQFYWQRFQRKRDALGREKLEPTGEFIVDYVDPAEPEISQENQIQEQIYQVLAKNNLLTEAGRPNRSILENPTPEQKEAIARAQNELALLLSFSEIAGQYTNPYTGQVQTALEETPALFPYPERQRRLGVRLGREYAQRVSTRFYEAWQESKGNQEYAQGEVRKFAVNLFQNPVGIEEAVREVFTPLNLFSENQKVIASQTVQSLRNYGSRAFIPLTETGEANLGALTPDLPKEVLLDVDPEGQPRLRVNPVGRPQEEKIYRPVPTRQGLINQTAAELEHLYGSDAYYFQFQLESFLANPAGTIIYWSVIDPAVGALEIIPGVSKIHQWNIKRQKRQARLLRWYYLTPQIKYLFRQKIKATLGASIGLYRNVVVGYDKQGRPEYEPVFTPIAWLGKVSQLSLKAAEDFFLFQGQQSTTSLGKRFWAGLGMAFRRRRADEDKNPLVVLVKLVLDLTIGTVARLIQRAVISRLANIFTKLTETPLGKQLLGRPVIRGLRMSLGMGKHLLRGLFSLNTLSGGFGGYLVGSLFGYGPQGFLIGGFGGWGYQFYLNIARDTKLIAWLQEPSANILSRAIRIIGRPGVWLAQRPYLRLPLKGLTFGYLLYLMGFPAWVVPIPAILQWVWETRGWWSRLPFFQRAISAIRAVPGVGFLEKILGFLSKFRLIFSMLGRLLFWATHGLLYIPLFLEIRSGVPIPVALSHWFFSFPFWGAWAVGELLFFTRLGPFLWGLFKGLALRGWGWFTGPVLEAISGFFSTLWAALTALAATYGYLVIFSIIFVVAATAWMINLWTSAFFQGREIRAHAISPHLPIEKAVAAEKNQAGEVIALNYTLTYTYQPPAEETGLLDNIEVIDTYEDLFQMNLNLITMFYLPGGVGPNDPISTFDPCIPDFQGGDPGFANTFAWAQKEGALTPIECPELGPLAPGESKTLTMHLIFRKPLNQFISGDQMLCDTLSVFGQIQEGERLSSSSIPVCIDAEGETLAFSWPTSVHSCSTNGNFGYRLLKGQCEFHEGIDISEPRGNPIGAAASGQICAQGWHNGYGYHTIISHGHGLFTLYAHFGDDLSPFDFPFQVGDNVKTGGVVGESGNSGDSYGAHLHFAVGNSCDINNFFDRSNVQDPCGYLPNCPTSCQYKPGC